MSTIDTNYPLSLESEKAIIEEIKLTWRFRWPVQTRHEPKCWNHTKYEKRSEPNASTPAHASYRTHQATSHQDRSTRKKSVNVWNASQLLRLLSQLTAINKQKNIARIGSTKSYLWWVTDSEKIFPNKWFSPTNGFPSDTKKYVIGKKVNKKLEINSTYLRQDNTRCNSKHWHNIVGRAI